MGLNILSAVECQFAAGSGQHGEDLQGQALVAQSSVEALGIAALDWVPWPDEVSMNTVAVGPQAHRTAGNHTFVVHDDLLWSVAAGDDPIQLSETFSPLSAVSA